MPSSSIERTTSFDPAVVKPKKTVYRRTSFAAVSVREYNQIIGDSPTCLAGAPVALGWSFQENSDIPLEEFEQARQPFRRRQSDLVLGVQERRSKLVESGVSLSDVLKAESFASLKKGASRLSSLKDVGSNVLAKSSRKKTSQQSSKKFDQKDKRATPPRTFPPLRKQMVSRAA